MDAVIAHRRRAHGSRGGHATALSVPRVLVAAVMIEIVIRTVGSAHTKDMVVILS